MLADVPVVVDGSICVEIDGDNGGVALAVVKRGRVKTAAEATHSISDLDAGKANGQN